MRCAVAILVVIACASANATPRFDTDDPAVIASSVAEVERGPADAETLFAAAFACEERLQDPGRAFALYERLLREYPNASVTIAAGRRATRLRAQLGEHNEHAAHAKRLAELIANADRLPVAQVVAQAQALIDVAWPGAVEAALWLAEWHRRSGRFAEAEAAYHEVSKRFDGTPQAELARRGAVGAAIDGHAWSHALDLVTDLPDYTPEQRIVRDELFELASRGLLRARLYTASWIVLPLAVLALLASLAEAILRGGRRYPSWKPPIEVLYLAPIALVIVGVSFTAHRAIAPAVTRITVVGLVMAYFSGITLDLLRARGRIANRRAIAHVFACMLAVVAIGYIAMTRDGLLELLIETVRFGPET